MTVSRQVSVCILICILQLKHRSAILGARIIDLSVHLTACYQFAGALKKILIFKKNAARGLIEKDVANE